MNFLRIGKLAYIGGLRPWALGLAVLTATAALAPAHSVEVLYRFKGGKDGAGPYAGLVGDGTGALYGTTIGRGSPACGGYGCGTVFKLSPPGPAGTRWTRTDLHRFGGPDKNDGVNPFGGLVRDGSGALYGTTASGGGPGYYGTVYKLTPPAPPSTRWTRSVIYRFKEDGSEGLASYAGLVRDGSGTLYGTTSSGGGGTSSYGYGTVFKLTPSGSSATKWTLTVLHRFQDGADGGVSQAALLLDGSGALYGTTSWGGAGGGGTVFKLTPPSPPATTWSHTVLHSFKGGADGYGSMASLVRDGSGALYGTTIAGGVDAICGGTRGCGTVFRLAPPAPPETKWTRTILYRFKGQDKNDGASPYAGLVLDGSGALYGAASAGGKLGYGTVFKLTPPTAPDTKWTRILLHHFGGRKDGYAPMATLLRDGSGALYGTAYNGETSFGTVFKIE